jgi:hypothetical protein
MKTLPSIFLSALIACLIVGTGGCKKNETVHQTCSNGIKDGDETGVDCGGSCTACAACNTYLPLKVGNKWLYYDFTYNTYLGALTITKDTVINGTSFFKTVRTDTANGYYEGSLYLRNSNGDIFEISEDAFDLFQDGINSGERLLLKENAAVGDSWTVISGTTRSIIEKGTTLIVAGQTFTDVIRVRETKGAVQNDFWYSKCIGLVKVRDTNSLTLASYKLN